MLKYFVFFSVAAIILSCNSRMPVKELNSKLEANTWKLTQMNGESNIAFAPEDFFTVSFSPSDSVVSGVGACNRFFGKFDVKNGGVISFRLGGSTMMACPNLELEQPYFQTLEKVNKLKFENEKLILFTGDEVVAEFISFIEVADMHTAENSLDYEGEYTGQFPAADCPGINIVLNLFNNNTFSMSMDYIDRDSKFTETGTYTVEENILTLVSDGSSQYYKIGENRLFKLDAEKQPIEGELADFYILEKKQ